jgi:Mce-associated membrane protein
VSADNETEQTTDGVEMDKAPDDRNAPAGADGTDGPDSTAAPGRTLSNAAIPPIPVIPLVLVLALLAAGGLAAWLYFAVYRPDKQVDAAVAQSAVDAARSGTLALLSYKPDTLDKDVAAAKSHLSGDFLNSYEEFTKQILSPAAKEKAVATTAQVVGAAATDVRPDSAVVLVFVNQVSTSRERPDPAMASSSVLVSLTKADGGWLITKFDPL